MFKFSRLYALKHILTNFERFLHKIEEYVAEHM